jgi:hypothetical protein
MCFQLYAGTTKPLPRGKWEHGSADLPVQALDGRDAFVKGHFGSPEVQFVGSGSGCGCDFPHVMLQGGAWPYFEDPDIDEQEASSERLNRERLVSLLQSSGDSTVELYGTWDGDFAEPPEAYELIALGTILHSDFRLKERGFYKVRIAPR